MPAPAPLIPPWLRQELAPTPGRWRQALFVAASSTTALLIALVFQFGNFPAPLMAFKSVLPNIVHSVPLLGLRLGAIAGGSIVGIWLAGVAVQLPWLLVPGFFAVLSVILYMVPIRQNPVAGYCLALTVVVVSYEGVFSPLAIGDTALSLAVGFIVGNVIAYLFAYMRALPPPRERLSAALATHLDALRATLATAGARFRAAEPPDVGGDAPDQSRLAAHLQLLALVRMQHIDLELERAFVALITADERLSLYVGMADHLARVGGGRTLRRGCDAEIGALLAAIDHSVARYAAVARTPTAVLEHGLVSADPWPDFDALLADLHAREEALAADPTLLTVVDVGESSIFHSFVQALSGMAEVLHVPPEAHEALPPDGGPPPARRLLPPFDKYAAQFAAKVSAACTITLLIGIVAHQPALETAVLNPLILAQGSYGATLRQAWLRMAGVLLGGVLAILTVIGFNANVSDVTVWLAFYFAIMVPCAYIALGGPRLAYLGLQTAITYMIIMIANRPVTDPHEALWRFLGTVVGAAVLFAMFQFVAPDYAGRQLVSRFADLLRLLLAAHPAAGGAPLSRMRSRTLSDQVTAALADVLRLVEEARYEGATSGVDHDAAVDAAGLLRRIAHRLALARRSRLGERPPLPPEAAAAQAQLDLVVRTRLQRLLAMLVARHHRARTDSKRHAVARAAARDAAIADRPDLAGPMAAFTAAADAVRHAHPVVWTREDVESLMAEVAHLRRVATLLPLLEDQLERTILPGSESVAVRTAPHEPPALTALLHHP